MVGVGQATVYELLISVANACMTVSSILATQLLAPLGAATCPRGVDPCPPGTIDNKNFDESGGPWKCVREGEREGQPQMGGGGGGGAGSGGHRA